MSNTQRFKDIEACAKAIKLRIPFEKQYDNVFDMLDGIIELCNEPVQEELPDTFEVTQYMIGDQWLAAGIPKRQPYTEQVEWCIRKKATKIKFRAKGTCDQDKEHDLTQFFSPTKLISK